MAQHRHKRETNARWFSGVRVPQLRPAVMAAPLAVAATVGAVSIGVLTAGPATVGVAAPEATRSTVAVDPSGALARQPSLSRGSADRLDAESTAPRSGATSGARTESASKTYLQRLVAPTAVRRAIAGAETRRWTTEALNLWTTPSEASAQTGVVEAGEPVLLTGREAGGRVEIVWGRSQTRWVTADYLTDEEPVGLGGDCTNGTSVPDGVSENVKKVHAAVCAAFPEITTYGTFRSDGEHSQGIAVDIMVSGDRGQEVADFVRDYAADLGVDYVIYAQQIWSVERSGDGWRGMEDRGSVTENHFDHVHVTTF